MKKVLLLALAAITSTVWLQRNTRNRSRTRSRSDQVEGCLKTVRGHYMVDDKNREQCGTFGSSQ